MSLDKDLKWW